MKTLTTILLLMLSACGVVTTPEKIAKASEVCKQNRGVKDIYIHMTKDADSRYMVECNNGGQFIVDVK
jgi:hypothetical protein